MLFSVLLYYQGVDTSMRVVVSGEADDDDNDAKVAGPVGFRKRKGGAAGNKRTRQAAS